MLRGKNDAASRVGCVSGPEGLTVDWAQAVVTEFAGAHTTATVENVVFQSLDVGTTSRVRLEVEYAGTLESLPTRWFVKLPSAHFRARLIAQTAGLIRNEARYYASVASQVSIEQPVVLATALRWSSGVVVMEDLATENVSFGSGGDGMTAGEARAAVCTLATLHAQFWNKTDTLPGWMDGAMRQTEDQLGDWLAVPLMRRGLRRAGEVVPPGLADSAISYARRRRHYHQQLNAGPATLVHRDCHPGNWFFRNGQAGLLDWQLARTGAGVGDLAYLIGTGLSPSIRRLLEDELVQAYIDALAGEGVQVRPDAIWRMYRRHLVYAFEAMVVTLAIGQMMPLAWNLRMIERTAAALADHTVFADSKLWSA